MGGQIDSMRIDFWLPRRAWRAAGPSDRKNNARLLQAQRNQRDMTCVWTRLGLIFSAVLREAATQQGKCSGNACTCRRSQQCASSRL